MSDFRFLLFNKPMNVLTRFTDDDGRQNLSDYIDVPKVYPVGRLDRQSEGLLLLTDHGGLVKPLLAPGGKSKTYLVAVEGEPSADQLESLAAGPTLKDGPSLPVEVEVLEGEPAWLWSREPPIRFRKSIPVSWLSLTLREGRNRQVRRMTAAVGLPTLRLVRTEFGMFRLGDLQPGEWREASRAERLSLQKLEPSSNRVKRRPRGKRKRGPR